jgi:hypothetical protein
MQIGIDAWIIQDGNYPDFEVGQSARFALEFYAHSVAAATAPVQRFTLTRPARYDLSGIVAFRTNDVWVIDAGFLAYSESQPPLFATLGSAVTGDFYLGIDPFFYFEDLCRLQGMPELRYEWRIDSIARETTPWISTIDTAGREVLQRDEPRTSYEPVDRTNAWHDDSGNGSYILECTRIGV